MANEQNLISNSERTPNELREQTRKGGINSGKARRRKADLKKMAQQVLDGTFKDKNGREFTGEEAIIQGLVTNLASPNSKNWGKAMSLMIELLEADKSRDEKQKLKAEVALLKAKVKLLTESDSTTLDKLDEVLGKIESNF